MPRERKWRSPAEKQAAYRQRNVTGNVTPEVTIGTQAVTPVPGENPSMGTDADKWRAGQSPAPMARGTYGESRPFDPIGSNVWPGMEPERARLRGELDRLRAEYGRYQKAMDWEGCKAVNEEREPLFAALWKLERGLPSGERYFFPARIMSEGQGFAAKRTA